MAAADITTDDDLWYELFERDYLPKPEDRIAQDGKSVPPPEALVHTSISTCKNFEKMVDFYMTAFNARPINFRDKRSQGGGRAAFLSFDVRDHRFAIIERLGWQEVEGKGHILETMVVHDTRVVRRKGDVPFNVAVVSLDEDPTINFLANLPGTPAHEAPQGAAVEILYEEMEPGTLIHDWRVVS